MSLPFAWKSNSLLKTTKYAGPSLPAGFTSPTSFGEAPSNFHNSIPFPSLLMALKYNEPLKTVRKDGAASPASGLISVTRTGLFVPSYFHYSMPLASLLMALKYRALLNKVR